MIIVLERGTTPEEERTLLAAVEKLGLEVNVLRGLGKPLLHVVDGSTRAARKLLRMERVEALIPTSGPRIRREGRRFYPYHFIDWCAAGLVLLGAVVALAGFLPPGLGAEVDPRLPPAALETPWYLRAPAALLDLIPGALGWLVLALLALAAFCVPLLDRSRAPAGRSLTRTVIALAALALWTLLTLRGAP